MQAAKERLVQWLRDAHAMEKQAETMLQSLSGRLEHYPELRGRIEQHIEETRNQARSVEQCLERCGADVSSMKDIAGRTTAMMQGMSGMFVGDEVVKGGMAGYTFEHFEICSYEVLIATAEAAGEAEVAATCRGILKEEEAMADWLRRHLPEVTRAFLSRESSGQEAKH